MGLLFRSLTSPVLWLLLGCCVAGCSSTAPPNVYVLAPEANTRPSETSQTGRPVVSVRHVVLPDYLDNTDLFVRDGRNALKSSTTGQWGERLSVGVTHAVAEDLTRRLPGFVIDQHEAAGRPSRTVLIDVDGFDVTSDGRCALTARWTILGEDGQGTGVSARATFVTMVGQSSDSSRTSDKKLTDAGVVAAMAAAVEQLADRVASDLSRSMRGRPGIR
jgi:uncharacterized lipoprotein YmbA